MCTVTGEWQIELRKCSGELKQNLKTLGHLSMSNIISQKLAYRKVAYKNTMSEM